MRIAGGILLIVAGLGWVVMGMFFVLVSAGLGALHDPQSQPEAVLLGTARLGLAAVLVVSAVLALRRSGRLPAALVFGGVVCGVVAGVATNRILPPFDWGLVGLAVIGSVLLVLGKARQRSSSGGPT
jgi:peptidoglycan/LPS O-acetylase OafA/YrhL